jgi:sulfonate transport system permease protein
MVQTLTRTASAPPREKSRPSAFTSVVPWLSPVVVVLLWWFASARGWISQRALPAPGPVVSAAVALTEDGTLPSALGASLGRVGAGVLLGGVFGLVLGVVSGYLTIGELVVDRPLQMLRAIPFNALLPLFVIAFGIGEPMKVLLIAEGVLIPVYLNTFAGIRAVDPRLLEVATVYQFPRLLVAVKILLLGALPSIFTGFRFALAIAWIALVTCETVNTSAGIGFVLTQAQRFVRPDRVVLCIVVYALLGVITDWIVRLLERRALRWRTGIVSR